MSDAIVHTSGPPAPQRLAILSEDDATAQARWEELDDAALQQEILRYRASYEDLAVDLASTGLNISLHTGEAADACGRNEQGAAGPDPAFGGTNVLLGNLEDLHPSEWQVPPHCVPIHANVTTYDWRPLAAAAQFDVIMMDPPWALATANPTRGVALGYSQLTDADIKALPVPKLQTNGFLFVWVINAKYKFTLDLFDHWGYRLVDEIVWVKMTVNRRLAKSHGYYLQHAKEACLVARKGAEVDGATLGIGSDVICAERRGQSQKPEEIYQLVEQLVPGGKYLEIFGRKNNLRNFWVTVGNEVTGIGLPAKDRASVTSQQRVPGAVYGRQAEK